MADKEITVAVILILPLNPVKVIVNPDDLVIGAN